MLVDLDAFTQKFVPQLGSSNLVKSCPFTVFATEALMGKVRPEGVGQGSTGSSSVENIAFMHLDARMGSRHH